MSTKAAELKARRAAVARLYATTTKKEIAKILGITYSQVERDGKAMRLVTPIEVHMANAFAASQKKTAWSAEALAYLEANYATMENRRIAAHLGKKLTTIQHQARKRGLVKANPIHARVVSVRRPAKPKKMKAPSAAPSPLVHEKKKAASPVPPVWTKERQDDVLLNYNTMSSSDLAKKHGVSMQSLWGIAKRLGIKKTHRKPPRKDYPGGVKIAPIADADPFYRDGNLPWRAQTFLGPVYVHTLSPPPRK